MEKIYFVICSKYKKFKNPKASNIFEKKKYFSLSIICSKCGNEDEKIFKEEESIVILKILGLIINIEKYQNNVKFISK